MNIIITGGAGFIGSHVTRALAKGHSILVIDNLSSGKKQRIAEVLGDSCKLVRKDITDVKAMKKLFSKFKPDIVVHIAAQVMLRRSIEDPFFDAKQNILGTISILEACKDCGTVKQVIYTSTGGARYGEPKRLPVSEKGEVCPLAPYGISKHTAEHYVEAYASLVGFDPLIVCFGNVYGPEDDPATKRIIAIICDCLLRGQAPTIFGDGDQTRDFLYVEDIAKVISASIGKRYPHHLFNLASGSRTSVNTLFKLISKELNSSIPAKHIEAIKGEVRDIELDIALARKELRFSPTPIEEGIKKTVAWFKTRY